MFSAYDIKKILPRAVLALVAINLSWALMNIMINAVGALGEMTQNLITAPFTLGVQSNIHNNAAGAVGAFAAMGAAAGIGIGLIPIAGVAVSGLFGILFAFGIAMLRRVCLIGLVVVAPVAIALSILPQTEKWAKQWWEWFSKLLLMYPFIMAFFGLSEVAAHLVSAANTSGSPLGSVQGVIYTLAGAAILIMPYFVVGKAFSLAGGAIGKVAGMVNNKDKGLIDRSKKWEANRVATNRSKAKGDRYAGNNVFTAGMNAGIRRVMNPRSLTSLDKQKRVAALVAGAAKAEAEYAERYKAAFEGLSSDGKKLLANSRGTERGARDYIKREAEEEYRNVRAQRIADGMTADEADVAAKMAMRQKQEALEREMHMLSSVGGINSTSARIGLKSAAAGGDLTMEQATRLSSELSTATGSPFGGWDQRSRVIAESTAGTVAKTGQAAFDKSLDELTARAAAATQAGRHAEAAAYDQQIDDLLTKGAGAGLSIPSIATVPTGKGGYKRSGKTEDTRQSIYTGSQSRSRVLVTDAVGKAVEEVVAGNTAAARDQVDRVLDHAVVAGASAAEAAAEKVGILPGEAGQQGVHDEVVGKGGRDIGEGR